MGTDSDDAVNPLRNQVDELAAQVRQLGQQLEWLRASSDEERAASDEALRRRDRRRDIMTLYLSLLCFAAVAGALLLIGRSIDYRHELGKAQLEAQRQAAPPPAYEAPGDQSAREIIERYIERQAQPTSGAGLGVSVSVNGVIDLVKSLGKAGVIGAKTVSDLTAELTKQGADVAAHTAKALVDKYLGPAPPPATTGDKAPPGQTGQQVLVNVYPGERRAVTVTPPVRKPASPCTAATAAGATAALR